ncbi:MAG TPA: hypothetical protein VFQ79_16600 [Bryobacteraceae bacterium]|nr:hypothetical protein [Bryobacteraceae bacterium]
MPLLEEGVFSNPRMSLKPEVIPMQMILKIWGPTGVRREGAAVERPSLCISTVLLPEPVSQGSASRQQLTSCLAHEGLRREARRT